MIIADDTPPSPLKGNYNHLPQQQPQQPPPSYGATQSQPYHFPASTQQQNLSAGAGVSGGTWPSHSRQPPSLQAYTPQVPKTRRESPARRFCKAFCVAVLIWMLFSLFVSGLRFAFNGRGNSGKRNGWDMEVPSRLSLQKCIRASAMTRKGRYLWAQQSESSSKALPYVDIPEIPEVPKVPDVSYASHTALASYDLSLSSSSLFLLARGAQSSGQLTVVVDSELSGDVARVVVKVLVYQTDMLEKSEVCLMERPDGGVGVGLFSPRTWPNRSYKERIHYEVTLKLPYLSAFEPHLKIRSFETDLPNFIHLLGALGDFVEFGRVELKGSDSNVLADSLKAGNTSIRTSNGMVDIKSLDAKEAEIYTSDGPIQGYYNVSGALDMKTSNAPIKSDVDLYSAKGKGKLSMYTKNGQIESNVNLLQSDSSTPEFTVTSTTSNAKLNLNIQSLPSSSPLFLNSKTSNNDAKVYLPATYEGAYTLSTSNASPIMSVDHKVDPEGRQRRNWVKKRVRNVLEGEIFWEEGNRQKGSVMVRSSNGRVEVHV